MFSYFSDISRISGLTSTTMLRGILFLLICSFAQPSFSQTLKAESLLCEYQANPIGIDATAPRFSWKLISMQNDLVQTSYEVCVGSDAKVKKIIWQSGKTASDQSVNIVYAGPKLVSKKKYYWQVRVSDNYKHTSAWSAVNYFEMGLLAPSDWSAKWIQSSFTEEPSRPAQMF